MFGNVEKVITSSPDGMERVKQVQQRIAGFRKTAEGKVA
jgi:hypothetical protein